MTNRTNLYWVLEGRETKTADLSTWATFFNDDSARTVGREVMPGEGDSHITVSTVFLGIDHNWGDGRPLLFETMIFGGPHNESMWRYTTYDEAEAGHQRVVDALRAGKDPA